MSPLWIIALCLLPIGALAWFAVVCLCTEIYTIWKARRVEREWQRARAANLSR